MRQSQALQVRGNAGCLRHGSKASLVCLFCFFGVFLFVFFLRLVLRKYPFHRLLHVMIAEADPHATLKQGIL